VGGTLHNREQGRNSNITGSDTLVYELHGNCYVNITNLCTLRCAFCPKFNKQWDVQGYDLSLSTQPSATDIIQAIGDPGRYNEVVFCGLGEPTMRLSVLLEVADAIHDRVRVRLNTDGLGNLVQGMNITPELSRSVNAVSISLNAQSEAVYNRHCRPPQTGTYPALLDFIASAKQHIDDITLTAIDGLEGVDIDACRAIADDYGVKFRRRVLDKVG
jgi:TatD DNase family protein